MVFERPFHFTSPQPFTFLNAGMKGSTDVLNEISITFIIKLCLYAEDFT